LTLVLKPSRGSGRFEAKAGVTYHILASDRYPANAPNRATIQLTLNSLRLVLPAKPSSLQAPAQIPVTILTTELANTVSQVELWANTNQIGTVSGPPFAFDWNNIQAGIYTLTARATRTTGEALQSVPVEVIVRPTNDEADNATVLTGSNIVATVYNVTASREPEDPQNLQFDYSVWYKWTAPAHGLLTVKADRPDWTNPHIWYSDAYVGTSRSNWTHLGEEGVGQFDRSIIYRVVREAHITSSWVCIIRKSSSS
jgi:hypothetical protein